MIKALQKIKKNQKKIKEKQEQIKRELNLYTNYKIEESARLSAINSWWKRWKLCRAQERREIAYEESWYECLMSMTSRNHVNAYGESFIIQNVKEVDFGMVGTIYMPSGLPYSNLEKIKETIEASTKSLLILKNDNLAGKTDVTIVNTIPDQKYTPVKCPPETILVGYDNFQKPYFLDLTEASPHLLITGASGTGKSYICFMVLANLIYNYDKDTNDFKIYLLQIMKTELGAYSSCAGVKGMYTSLQEVDKKLTELNEIAHRRGEALKNSSVKKWNEHNPDNKMPPIYVFVDELAFFMPGEAQDKNDPNKKMKLRCIQSMIDLGRAGRSCGIHICALCQRGTAKNIDPNMKSNFARLTAYQNSATDSDVVIECSDATKLLDRQVLLKTNKGLEMLYIPTLAKDCSDLLEAAPGMTIPKPLSKEEKEDFMKRYGSIDYFNNIKVQLPNNEEEMSAGDILVEAIDNNGKITTREVDGKEVVEINTTVPQHATVDLKDKTINLARKSPEKVKAPSANEVTAFRHIEEYGYTTTSTMNAVLNSKYGTKLLPRLEKENRLVVKQFDKTGQTKFYFLPNSASYKNTTESNIWHKHCIMLMYNKLYEAGFTFIDTKNNKGNLTSGFRKEKKTYTPNGSMFPDAEVFAEKDGVIYHIFYEVDDTHPTDPTKLEKYESIVDKDFILIISTKPKARIYQTNSFKVIRENHKLDLGFEDKIIQPFVPKEKAK